MRIQALGYSIGPVESVGLRTRVGFVATGVLVACFGVRDLELGDLRDG
jgi:hypothetical protein